MKKLASVSEDSEIRVGIITHLILRWSGNGCILAIEELNRRRSCIGIKECRLTPFPLAGRLVSFHDYGLYAGDGEIFEVSSVSVPPLDLGLPQNWCPQRKAGGHKEMAVPAIKLNQLDAKNVPLTYKDFERALISELEGRPPKQRNRLNSAYITKIRAEFSHLKRNRLRQISSRILMDGWKPQKGG